MAVFSVSSGGQKKRQRKTQTFAGQCGLAGRFRGANRDDRAGRRCGEDVVLPAVIGRVQEGRLHSLVRSWRRGGFAAHRPTPRRAAIAVTGGAVSGRPIRLHDTQSLQRPSPSRLDESRRHVWTKVAVTFGRKEMTPHVDAPGYLERQHGDTSRASFRPR